MKLIFRIVLAFFVTLLAGCTLANGVYVKIRSESFDALKREVIPFLVANGFQHDAETVPFNDSFSLRPRTADAPRQGLYANFFSDGKEYSFFIGKGAQTFTAEERTIIDACVALITSHAEFVISGSASKESTSVTAREMFYAKIKKPGKPLPPTVPAVTPATEQQARHP
jgi:hypothetical protein